MTFIDELKEALMPEYARLLETRIFQALASDEKAGGGKYASPLDLWKFYLWETYHYTKHNGVNQALCVMRTPTTEKKLLHRQLRHAIEEIDHDFLALHDLETMGVDREQVIASRPEPETQAFASLIYDLVIRERPIGRLGYSFWAEGALNEEQLPYIAERVRYHFDLSDDQMTFLVAHSELDKGHSRAAVKAIEEHVRDGEDREAVIYFGKATCRMYYHFLEGVFDKFEREQARLARTTTSH
jgi:pyrroloquinoline quinone (PQQ) biosynthesis protein C